MFKDNKYTKWYFQIIENAKRTRPLTYKESHHIIPKCLGGDDCPDNLIDLTAREHFLCHMLLTKMHDDHRLKYALVAMSLINPNQVDKRHTITSSQYEYVKRCNSKAASERLKGHTGHNLNRVMAYKGSETKFFASENEIPNGWTRGHNPNTRKNMIGKNSGKSYYHNPETGEVKTFASQPSLPWIKGNPNADTSHKTNIKGKSYYHNPETGEEGRYLYCPTGWVKGRSVIWINDGMKNKQHSKTAPIPEGWKRGRMIKWKTR